MRGSQIDSSLNNNVTIIVSVESRQVSPRVAFQLKQQLNQQNDHATDVLALDITRAAFKRRVIVLDADAKPAELALIFQLDYMLKINEQAAKSGVISTDKNYFFAATAIASVDHYETMIEDQLIQQATAILRQRIQQHQWDHHQWGQSH